MNSDEIGNRGSSSTLCYFLITRYRHPESNLQNHKRDKKIPLSLSSLHPHKNNKLTLYSSMEFKSSSQEISANLMNEFSGRKSSVLKMERKSKKCKENQQTFTHSIASPKFKTTKRISFETSKEEGTFHFNINSNQTLMFSLTLE